MGHKGVERPQPMSSFNVLLVSVVSWYVLQAQRLPVVVYLRLPSSVTASGSLLSSVFSAWRLLMGPKQLPTTPSAGPRYGIESHHYRHIYALRAKDQQPFNLFSARSYELLSSTARAKLFQLSIRL